MKLPKAARLRRRREFLAVQERGTRLHAGEVLVLVKGTGADRARIGITDYAQEQLGEIVFVELPQVGKEFAAHKEISVVESSKAAGDVYCPVAGKVTEVNTALESEPELVNQDCYGAGWICKLKITDAKALAVAIAYRAIQNGYEALFTSAAEMIESLSVVAVIWLLCWWAYRQKIFIRI